MRIYILAKVKEGVSNIAGKNFRIIVIIMIMII